MKKALEYNAKYVGVTDEQMTKATVAFANKRWQKAYDLAHFDNEKDEANLLAAFIKLYSAAQLEKPDAAEDAHILLNYTDFEFWVYLEEHNFPRYARRFAYQFLAYIEAENKNYNDALNYIEEALFIGSPIDNLDNIPLYEQKIQILLDSNKTEEAFYCIQRLLKRDENNDTFSEIIQSKDYQEYLKSYNLDDLISGKPGETAKEALERYKRFLNLHYRGNDELIESLSPYFFAKVSEEEILEAEERLGFKFPPSYRNFVLEYGLFQMGNGDSYESSLFEPGEINTLYSILKDEWNTDIEEIDFEGAKECIVFSYGDESLQMVYYYYFDKRTLNPETGEMRIEPFDQDEWLFDNPSSMCQCDAFDAHISEGVVDRLIKNILD